MWGVGGRALIDLTGSYPHWEEGKGARYCLVGFTNRAGTVFSNMHWSDILDNLSTLKTWVTVRSRRTTFCGVFWLQAVFCKYSNEICTLHQHQVDSFKVLSFLFYGGQLPIFFFNQNNLFKFLLLQFVTWSYYRYYCTECLSHC